MEQVAIENPVLNSPYWAPARRFRLTEDGITSEIVEARRVSSYFVPIPAPKKSGAHLAFDTEWTHDHVKENDEINHVRERVAIWRRGGYVGLTSTTRRLIEYWQRPDRDRQNAPDDPLNLVVEVCGQDHGDKATKVATARNLWVPAVNNHGACGRWALIEITDPNDTENPIRAPLASQAELPL